MRKSLGNLMPKFNYFDYQKTKIIGSLAHIDEALDRMVKADFFTRYNRSDLLYIPYGRGDKNAIPHAFFYEEALFLNYMLDKWNFDMTKLSEYERKDYEAAEAKLRLWKDVYNIRREVGDFIKQIKGIIQIRRQNSSVEALELNGYPVWEEDVIAKYDKLMAELKDFPAWAEKVDAEVGGWVKLLSDQTGVENRSLGPYAEFNLNKYFK